MPVIGGSPSPPLCRKYPFFILNQLTGHCCRTSPILQDSVTPTWSYHRYEKAASDLQVLPPPPHYPTSALWNIYIDVPEVWGGWCRWTRTRWWTRWGRGRGPPEAGRVRPMDLQYIQYNTTSCKMIKIWLEDYFLKLENTTYLFICKYISLRSAQCTLTQIFKYEYGTVYAGT